MFYYFSFLQKVFIVDFVVLDKSDNYSQCPNMKVSSEKFSNYEINTLS